MNKDDFIHIIHTLQLAAGLLFSVFLMIQGMGHFTDGLLELARAKMLVGLGLGLFCGVYGFNHLIITVELLKLLLLPLLYISLALCLNYLLGTPFTNWPLASLVSAP